MINESKEYHISLRDIASWQIKLKDTDSRFKARLPSLQRGDVWKADQIELLWDSILRGFPIGSLTLSKRIKGQNAKASHLADKGSNLTNKEDFDHFILDGQQRCNAIAMGNAVVRPCSYKQNCQ